MLQSVVKKWFLPSAKNRHRLKAKASQKVTFDVIIDIAAKVEQQWHILKLSLKSDITIDW